MAASTLPLQQIRYAGTISGNQPMAGVVDIASGQTVHAGDIVVSSAGKAAVSATPVPTGNTVLGVSMHGAKQGTAWYLVPEDGSGTLQQEDTGGTFGGTFMGASNLLGSLEGTGVHYIIANQDTLFWITYKEPIGLDQLGVQVQIVQDATTKVWRADSGGTAVAQIVGIPNYVGQLYVITGTTTPVNTIPAVGGAGGTGDVNYPVIIRFLTSATAQA